MAAATTAATTLNRTGRGVVRTGGTGIPAKESLRADAPQALQYSAAVKGDPQAWQ